MAAKELDIKAIMQRIPHRYPFLLIDKVLEVEPANRILAQKNVSINEPFFNGHFPGNPVMPGVLIVEALAQASALMVAESLGDERASLVYFMSMENAKFRKPVVPGDVMMLDVTALQNRRNVWKTHCEAKVDGAVVTEVNMTAMIAETTKEALPA